MVPKAEQLVTLFPLVSSMWKELSTARFVLDSELMIVSEREVEAAAISAWAAGGAETGLIMAFSAAILDMASFSAAILDMASFSASILDMASFSACILDMASCAALALSCPLPSSAASNLGVFFSLPLSAAAAAGASAADAPVSVMAEADGARAGGATTAARVSTAEVEGCRAPAAAKRCALDLEGRWEWSQSNHFA